MLRRGATVVLCAMVFLSQWGCGGGKKKGSLCQVGSDCPYACLQGECVTGGCGSTVCTGANEVCVKRADGSEQCDDMNDADVDGCDTDYTFSCEMYSHCDDADACNGACS